MKVLKGFGIAILNFLLFLSLSVFGIAFTVNSTLLNPNFVTAEVDKVDIPAVARELTEEQIGRQLPAEALFLKEAIYDVINDQELWIKEQLNAAINSGYDFFLGESEKLNIVVVLEPLKESLRESLWQTFKQYLPAELAGLSEDQLRPYFDQYYQEFASQIPSNITIDENSIPPEAMEQITLARQYIGYFQTGYIYLVVFIVLLLLGIIFINRNVRDTTRGLGITLMIYGALEFAGVFLARNYMSMTLPLQAIPSSLRVWTAGLFSDLLAPLQAFSLGILVGGAVLLVASFVYRPRTVED